MASYPPPLAATKASNMRGSRLAASSTLETSRSIPHTQLTSRPTTQFYCMIPSSASPTMKIYTVVLRSCLTRAISEPCSLTDIFGHKFINNQLIADQFAANGYFTFMPDLFNGDPVPANRPESFDVAEWRKSHTTAHVTPIVEASIKELREKYHVKKIAAVGYCYGAKYVVRHLKAGQIDVGYVAHPSHVDADELKAIQGPLSIAAAETDSLFPTEKRHESEEILKNLGVPYQINLYSGVIHGFAVRSDLSVKAAKYAKEAAFFQAIQWFNEYVE